ncbi:MAG: hypothetical protein IJ305_02395, partial [Oscillospiraceae bacterium]|nr:hypothetical protein [Oscillospiraceae bacterium]
MGTQYIAYYKNDNGGIGMYSWVCDVELCDLPDYQARQTKRCKKCGAVITGAEVHIPPTVDGSYPLKDEDSEDISHRMNPSTGRAGPPPFNKGGIVESDGEAVTSKRESVSERFDKIKNCPFCESKSFEMIQNDFEELTGDIVRSDGFIIPALTSEVQTEYDELGLPYEVSVSVPTRIPFYKPDLFPVVLIKNVSVHGQLLGDSDIDKVTDAQNTTNRMWRKVLDKITSGGSYITLPPDATIKRGPDEMMCIYLDNPADKALIGVHDMEGNVSQDLNAIMQVYEESRQAIGITDSFQGRVDRTATSGKSKEFAAVQSAGRLESKRVMKEAAYAELYELMFKFKLAYADEPRPVMSKDVHGNAVYSEFNRYDFLEVDVAGEYFWNDDFLFSCDSSEPLSRNREAMWQETRLNFQSGTFGDPAALKTRILFWTKMEQLHYPGASDTKAFLEEELAEEQRQMQLQQQM